MQENTNLEQKAKNHKIKAQKQGKADKMSKTVAKSRTNIPQFTHNEHT